MYFLKPRHQHSIYRITVRQTRSWTGSISAFSTRLKLEENLTLKHFSRTVVLGGNRGNLISVISQVRAATISLKTNSCGLTKHQQFILRFKCCHCVYILFPQISICSCISLFGFSKWNHVLRSPNVEYNPNIPLTSYERFLEQKSGFYNANLWLKLYQ